MVAEPSAFGIESPFLKNTSSIGIVLPSIVWQNGHGSEAVYQRTVFTTPDCCQAVFKALFALRNDSVFATIAARLSLLHSYTWSTRFVISASDSPAFRPSLMWDSNVARVVC